MDLGSAHGVTHLLVNEHSWYRFVTTDDYLRAAAWCIANIGIGVSYLMLPVEIRRWHLALPFKSTTLIGSLFISFIALCGISHLTMVVIMPTAPWWAILLVYVPTMLVSVGTVVVVRRERRLIVAALEGVGAALAESSE